MFRNLRVFFVVVVCVSSASAFALDCQKSQLLTDIVACRDNEISASIKSIERHEQRFV